MKFVIDLRLDDSYARLGASERSSRRNPDVRPPSRAIHRLGKPLWEIGHRLTKPDVLFGIKAGVFTCELWL